MDGGALLQSAGSINAMGDSLHRRAVEGDQAEENVKIHAVVPSDPHFRDQLSKNGARNPHFSRNYSF